jgi:Uma2 family endonuclease
MSTAKPPHLIRIEYENAAEAYSRSLPLEHFMEATAQGTQREIFVESMALVKPDRPDVHYFNELLVQYPQRQGRQIGQVVPDNMVVISEQPIKARGSYDLPFQPVCPFWVLEYVSKSNKRKDYEDSFHKYERDLKVPYFLLFYPDSQDLTLYHHTSKKYVTVKPNEAERFPITELDLEVALLDGWARFWYKGKLLPLPADLQRALNDMRRQLKQVKRSLKQAQEEAKQAQEEAKQAQEEAKQAQERAERERHEKERLLAQLRALGIEPR